MMNKSQLRDFPGPPFPPDNMKALPPLPPTTSVAYQGRQSPPRPLHSGIKMGRGQHHWFMDSS